MHFRSTLEALPRQRTEAALVAEESMQMPAENAVAREPAASAAKEATAQVLEEAAAVPDPAEKKNNACPLAAVITSDKTEERGASLAIQSAFRRYLLRGRQGLPSPRTMTPPSLVHSSKL